MIELEDIQDLLSRGHIQSNHSSEESQTRHNDLGCVGGVEGPVHMAHMGAEEEVQGGEEEGAEVVEVISQTDYDRGQAVEDQLDLWGEKGNKILVQNTRVTEGYLNTILNSGVRVTTNKIS